MRLFTIFLMLSIVLPAAASAPKPGHSVAATSSLRVANPSHIVRRFGADADGYIQAVDPSPDGRWLCQWIEYTLWITSTTRPHWRRVHTGDGVGSWRADSRAYTFVARNNARTGNRIVTVELPGFHVRSIRSPFGHPELPTWSPTGKSLVVFDCPQWSSIMHGFEGGRFSYAIPTSPDFDTYTDVVCWITPSGRMLGEIPGKEWGPHGCLAFSPDGKHLAYTTTNYRVGDEGALTIVDVSTGKSIEPFQPHSASDWRDDCAEPIAVPNDDYVIVNCRQASTFASIKIRRPFTISTVGKGVGRDVVGSCIIIDNTDRSDKQSQFAVDSRYGGLRYRISPSGIKNVNLIDVVGDHYATAARWIWVCDKQNAVGYRIGQ